MSEASIRFACRMKWREEATTEAPESLTASELAIWRDEAKKVFFQDVQSELYS